MIAELGHFALILAFTVAIFQMVVPMLGAMTGRASWMRTAAPAATVQLALTLGSFFALTYSFVVSDFSLRVVTLNSHTLKPLIYKFSGVWGNHEGSLLLWVLILTLFGACVAWFGTNLPPTLRARILSVQSSVAVAFFAFILFTSNPFWRLAEPPMNGQGLNPLLQDPGLIIHPPFLYLGYVGLSLTYSFAVAALLEGRVDAAWGRWVRPWTLAAWLFLTVGIGLGSWWAYYELGWGGFWFWDPVENASFMPWLLCVALLHSAIVVEKREALKAWTILLAIVAFGFALIGAFIVRSGTLTSVHAFANDPERGLFLLAITGIFLGGGLTLFAFRSGLLQARGTFAVSSRESALVMNNLLLAVSTFVVFIGTIWPLISELFFDRVLSVGPPFFDKAFTPFMVGLALLLPVGAMVPWKRARLAPVIAAMAPWGVLCLGMFGLAWAMQTGNSLLGPSGMALGAWVVSGACVELWKRTGADPRAKLRRLRTLPRADWGKAVAHAGFGVTLFGCAALTAWQVEDIRVATFESPYDVAGYEITLREVTEIEGPNYFATMARISIKQNGAEIGELRPEKRIYPVAGMPTTEAAIENGVFRDLYVVIGDEQPGGGWVVRTFVKPFANWIWGGAILMALGGLISLFDRRYRVGPPTRATHGGRAQ